MKTNRAHVGLAALVCLLATSNLQAFSDGEGHGVGAIDALPQSTSTPVAEAAPVEVDSSGAATYTIPIEVPSWQQLRPNVALRYSSRRKTNSWVGVGWDLSFGSITRSGPTGGVPLYRSLADDEDQLFLDIPGVLQDRIVRSGSGWGTRRESFTRIRQILGTTAGVNTVGWEVTLKNGWRYLFEHRVGFEAAPASWQLSSIIDTNGNSIVARYTKADGSNGWRTSYLSSLEWNARSGLVTSYFVDFNLEQGNRWDRPSSYRAGYETQVARRLRSIDVYAKTRATGVKSPIRSYWLSYEDPGQERDGRSLLSSVEQRGSDGTSALPPHRFSYQRNQLVGSSKWNPTNKTLPPELMIAAKHPCTEAQGPGCADEDPTRPLRGAMSFTTGTVIVDLDGDGAADAAQAFEDELGRAGPWKFGWRNGNDGSAALFAPSTAYQLPEPLLRGRLDCDGATCDGIVTKSIYDTGWRLVDIDGDGRPDMVGQVEVYNSATKTTEPGLPITHTWRGGVTTTGAPNFERVEQPSCVFPAPIARVCTDGSTDANGKRLFKRCCPTMGSTDRGVRFADLNGDGYVDVLQGYLDKSGGVRKAWLNDGKGCFKASDEYAPPDYFVITSKARDTGLRVVDINGDGLADLSQVRGSGTASPEYSARALWINNGAGGSFAPESAWSIVGDPSHPFLSVPTLYNGMHVVEGELWSDVGVNYLDLNGDGLTDVLESLYDQDDPRSRAWINTSMGLKAADALAPPQTNGETDALLYSRVKWKHQPNKSFWRKALDTAKKIAVATFNGAVDLTEIGIRIGTGGVLTPDFQNLGLELCTPDALPAGVCVYGNADMEWEFSVCTPATLVAAATDGEVTNAELYRVGQDASARVCVTASYKGSEFQGVRAGYCLGTRSCVVGTAWDAQQERITLDATVCIPGAPVCVNSSAGYDIDDEWVQAGVNVCASYQPSSSVPVSAPVCVGGGVVASFGHTTCEEDIRPGVGFFAQACLGPACLRGTTWEGSSKRTNYNPGVVFADIDGDGLPEAIAASNLVHEGRVRFEHRKQVSKSGAVATELLRTIALPTGGEIELNYRPAGASAKIPIPVQVLSHVRRRDLGGSSSWQQTASFDYRDGVFVADGQERGFLGFKMVTKYEPSADTRCGGCEDVTETSYDTDGEATHRAGRVHTVRIGRRTSPQSTAKFVSAEDYQYDPDADGKEPFYEPLTRVQRIHFGPGTVTATIRRQYDQYGNVIEELEQGFAGPGDERRTTREFAHDTSAWILDRPIWEMVAHPTRTGPGDAQPAACDPAVVEQAYVVRMFEWDGGYRTASSRGNLSAVRTVGCGASESVRRFNHKSGVYLADPYGRVVSIDDPMQRRMSFGYDSALGALITKVVDPSGRSASRRYHGITSKGRASDTGPFGRLAAVVETNTAMTTYSYDALGRLIRISRPGDYPAQSSLDTDPLFANGSRSFAYTVDGLDPTRNAVEMRETRRLVDPASGTAWQPSASATSVPAGAYAEIDTMTTQYDGRWRPIASVRFADSGAKIVRARSYFARGMLRSATVPTLGSVSSDAIEYDYDAAARVTRIRTPFKAGAPAHVLLEYRAEGKGVDERLSVVTTSLHDPLRAAVGPERQKRTATLDGLGRMTSTNVPCAIAPCPTWSHGYDVLGQLRSIADPSGNKTIDVYDGLGRRLASDDPNHGKRSWQYDAAGRLYIDTDASGATIKHAYDALDRLTQKTYSTNSDWDVELFYDGDPSFPYAAQAQATKLDVGTLTGMVYGGGKSWSYWRHDARGNVTDEMQHVEFHGEQTSIAVRQRYNSIDAVETVDYPSGSSLRYDYGRQHRPTRIAPAIAGVSYDARDALSTIDTPLLRATYDYHPASHDLARISLCRGPGKVESYTPPSLRDGSTTQPPSSGSTDSVAQTETALGIPLYLPPSSTTGGTTSSTTFAADCLMDLRYGAYDALGNVLATDETVLGEHRMFGYDYDRENQLLKESRTLPANGHSQYGYTAVGNLTEQRNYLPTPTGVKLDSGFKLGYAGFPSHAPQTRASIVGGITGASTAAFGYDDLGDTVWQLERARTSNYDQQGRLTSIHDGSRSADLDLLYDGLGRVVAKTRATPTGTTTTFYWNDSYEEEWSAGQVARRASFMLGRQRLAIEERVKSIATGTIKTTTRYLHGDRLGSTRLVTTDTHAFGPAWYSPYGVTQGSLPTRYAFAGQEAEAEVGLVQMGARYLDPALGRMVTPDPYRFRNRHLLNPKRDNMFAYGLNNPLNMVDPSGFDPITVTDATGTHEIGEGMTIVGQAPARSPQPTPIATPQAGPAPTAAGVTITGSPDLSSAWQLIMPPPTFPGFFRYDAHGGGGFVDVPKQYNPNTGAPIGTERHFTEKASTLARFIRSHREYQENMPVILNVCRAGAGWDNSIGQKLANEMGVRVLAPTGEVNVAGDIVGEGAWVSFEPQF